MKRSEFIKKGNGKIVTFKKLPMDAKISLVIYMAFDGEAQEPHTKPNDKHFAEGKVSAYAAKEIKDNISYYDNKYGKEKFGYGAIKASIIVDTILASSTIKEAGIYTLVELIREDNYSKIDRAKKGYVILGSEEFWEEETIQDGWHRLTNMLENKVKEIPFVYYLQEDI